MMLKKTLAYFAIILMISACYKYDKPKKPKNLISKDKMVSIIMDIRLLSSANGANKTTLLKNNLKPETYVFDKYKIDSLQFALSNSYYAYHIDDYEAIYTKVEDSLEGLKKEFDKLVKLEAEEKKVQDSIQNLIKKDSIHIIKLKDHISLLIKKDSLKPLIKKDSVRLVVMRDSLRVLIKNDSVTRFNLNPSARKELISPVSDIDFQ